MVIIVIIIFRTFANEMPYPDTFPCVVLANSAFYEGKNQVLSVIMQNLLACAENQKYSLSIVSCFAETLITLSNSHLEYMNQDEVSFCFLIFIF